ncbi:Hypothetical cytosolic protein [Bifidobacterium animalis subsp. lactis CNCM I-2494]|uniref:Hypothetical cytosolic protein n=1 Tax=Bifidobacterium animalis subsp. lactis CNCM I-2494 TaxID=1042403 RepID=A0A806FS49_BIFAN|nr:Hypothetical cytosolic protein [Bifidobacterium animalis subsp. lactis CNCM I-2494]
MFTPLNEAPKPRLRRFRLLPAPLIDLFPSMKLRSRDFGDISGGIRPCGWDSLNEAPKPRLRRCVWWKNQPVTEAAPSMKLRSRDFGDSQVNIGGGGLSSLNEAPKPRLRRSDSILRRVSNGDPQ